MKQSHAHTLIIISLILSLISFILSLIAFYLPYWKYIQLRSTPLLSTTSDDNQMDPLIRGEVEKYIELLYRPGDIHSFGLFIHCIVGGDCGQNRLPSFHETNYDLCHNIKFHQQCIFPNSVSVLVPNKCTCQKPSYINITHTLLTIILIFEILFIFINILRLCRRHRYCLNDIHLRLIAIVLSLFSSVVLIVIIIQLNNNRPNEPLEFFQSMHRHYSRIQIYTFSNNLELILKQIEQNLEIRLGACYICIIFILILTLITFLTSSTVEIKNSSIIDEDEKQNIEQNHQLIHSPPLRKERFVPSEQIRFIRQTKV